MNILATLWYFLLLAASSLAVTVSFDRTYDNRAGSTLTVSCSNGPNGLAGRFPTFGSFPSFPRIGGAAAVEGFGSANCGSCWALAFNGTTINVLAIDHAAAGFNIALAAMNTLTHNQAEFLGRVDATAVQANATACGL